MKSTYEYCCIERKCKQAILKPEYGGLSCPHGHWYPFLDNSEIPVFATAPDEDLNEYSLENAAERHDNALLWLFNTFHTNEETLRNNLVNRLDLKGNSRVLVTGAGAGNDIPFIADKLSSGGEIYVQDLSKEMLMVGYSRLKTKLQDFDTILNFSVSDATNLPFTDDFFDAAFHFGGINLYKDIKLGVSEMNRVVKPGGKVVFGDEGLAPWLRETELGYMLIENNYLYACNVPLEALPATAEEVNLSWELQNSFYVIDFKVGSAPVAINLDVPHIGVRGGTIRSRYLGKLEGIDPDLRDRVFEKARKLGVSRVEFIESVMRTALNLDS